MIFIKNIIFDENSKTFIIGLSSGTFTFFDMTHHKFLNNSNNNEQNEYSNKKLNFQDLENTN